MPPAQSTSTYVPTLLPGYQSRPTIRRSARACEFCRRSKARCDGPDAQPCRRCREGGIACVFEAGSRSTSTGSSSPIPRRTSSSKIDTINSSAHVNAAAMTLSGLETYSVEARIQRLEAEMASIRRTSELHSARLKTGISPAGDVPNGQLPPSPFSSLENEEIIDLNDPAMEVLARSCFDEFFAKCSPWAPCISPTNDTFDLLRIRSPLLMFCILAICSRFQDNTHFTSYCETQSLALIRATLYSIEPPTLDDLKATICYNAWLGRSTPPGHSVSLALSLQVPASLPRLLKSIELPIGQATLAFEELMPQVRAWFSLYSQDLWFSVASGRRSMVSIDYSIASARSLLKFASLRPIDTRIIAQAELVTILAGVQEAFLKIQLHSMLETVGIITKADEQLDAWLLTWGDWAVLQGESTRAYMTSSFRMQCTVGRFYVNTLCLRDMHQLSDITEQQMPCIQASVTSAMDIQDVALVYGADRLGHSTDFTLVSVASAALFLLKMIKLLPLAVDIQKALSAVRTTSHLLSSAPIKQYHFAVAAALTHLESQLSPASTAFAHAELPTSGLDEKTFGGEHDLFDPELELAISSVVHGENFWSWEQSLPADSFAAVLS